MPKEISDEQVARQFMALGQLAKEAGIKIGFFIGSGVMWLDELPGAPARIANEADKPDGK
jgi:hypothetical protein